jgi:dTDP-4-dehydrorhamnose 3,5-epimerase-like enzyme
MALGTIQRGILQTLTRYPDDRGFFEEIIRAYEAFVQEGFGQLSHSKMYPGGISVQVFA